MKRGIVTLLLVAASLPLTSFDYAPSHNVVAATGLPLPSNADIVSGLKQALEQGTTKSATQLSALNGYFGNAAIKILMPPEAQKAEKALRKLGLNKVCDDVILSLNRAAEDAAKQAAPIFVDAVKQMSVQDAANILTGSNDAATQYFKRSTTAALSAQFKPVIHTSLGKVGATTLYTQMATQYNKIPLNFSKLNPDLDDYVTQKAIDGLFYQIALEELNIRQNLTARTTPILQKVFGALDKK